MDNIEQLKIRYDKTRENDDLVETSPHIWSHRNEPERRKIREEYISLLPKNKKLAIFLHDKLCHCSHTDVCSWYYEMHELEDDWDAYEHKNYLDKANKALEVCSDENLIMNLIEAIE